MTRRMQRSKLPRDPAAIMRSLRSCRDVVIALKHEVEIRSPIGAAADSVHRAIDALAILMTGDERYFWPSGGGDTDGQRAVARDRAARERGELPWVWPGERDTKP